MDKKVAVFMNQKSYLELDSYLHQLCQTEVDTLIKMCADSEMDEIIAQVNHINVLRDFLSALVVVVD